MTDIYDLLREKDVNQGDGKLRELLGLIDNLATKKVFLPKGNIKKPYNLMKDAPGLFVEFASLTESTDSPSERILLKWLSDYGALFQNYLAEESFSLSQDLMEIDFKVEKKWALLFDEYIILKDTLIKTSKIAQNSLQLLIALRVNDSDLLDSALSDIDLKKFGIELHSLPIDNYHGNWDRTRELLLNNVLLSRIQCYTQKAIPAFDYIPAKNQTGSSLKVTREWIVPDQFRAMWIQFYEYIVKSVEFASCSYCGKKFAVMDKRQQYCHPRPGALRSRCQNTAYVGQSRKKR